MLDNPWAELEERLQTKVGNDSESSMDDSDNESLNGSEGSAKNESVNSICPDSF